MKKYFVWLLIILNIKYVKCSEKYSEMTRGAVVVVIVWLLDLQLPMQSVSITIDVVSSNVDQGEVYNIMW
jgi:hypothetical protein